MEDRIKEIRVKSDEVSDALAFAINCSKVISGSIERGKNDNTYVMTVLLEDAIIYTSFEGGECEGFSITKDKVRPEKHAIITLLASISDNNFYSIHNGWDADADEFVFRFNKDE